MEWTCRSRCWTKSAVEMPARTSPRSAPTNTTQSHAGGFMPPCLHAEARCPRRPISVSRATANLRVRHAGHAQLRAGMSPLGDDFYSAQTVDCAVRAAGMNGLCLLFFHVHHSVHRVPFLLMRTAARVLQLALSAQDALTSGCQ